MAQVTLRSAREMNGYSMEDIAVVCGITVEDVKMYEEDTRKMPFDLAKKAKRLFRINIEQIFVGLESEYVKNHR
ncbi:helix-turn-helix domain-containing protein [Desulfosporosinus fructosivorans]|uniref:helix-turn-helix domain-containing protein n=1 Tax=Desulfosporosinus fructosivorans TaxID=2018669 RepID=UPI00107FD8CA|nr:helix-turn-helix transcriptional regulator [Desulfosporosinus fructosivorans]